MDEGDMTTGETAGGRSFLSDLATLIEDGRTFAEAELAYQKGRLTYAGKRGLRVAIGVLLAAVCAVFSLFALVIGLIIGLAPYLTIWGATGALIIGLLGMALICLLIARHNARRIGAAFKEDA